MNFNKVFTLKELAILTPGAANSVYSPDSINGLREVKLLKGINLNNDGSINNRDMEIVALSDAKNPDRYILQAGDVVIMTRGSSIRACFVDQQIAKETIMASANFVIIRPNTDKIKGEVITAYLNSSVGMQRLQALSKGAVISHVSKADLAKLEIPVPSIEAQERISDIYFANQEAYQATLELAEQQKRTANATMLNMMLEVA